MLDILAFKSPYIVLKLKIHKYSSLEHTTISEARLETQRNIKRHLEPKELLESFSTT